jgi:hypothetical protein
VNSPHIPNFNTRCSLQFVLEERATSGYWVGEWVSFTVRQKHTLSLSGIELYLCSG